MIILDYQYKIIYKRNNMNDVININIIDKNGDGTFETTITSDMELTTEEFKEAVSRPVLSFKLTPRTFNLRVGRHNKSFREQNFD